MPTAGVRALGLTTSPVGKGRSWRGGRAPTRGPRGTYRVVQGASLTGRESAVTIGAKASIDKVEPTSGSEECAGREGSNSCSPTSERAHGGQSTAATGEGKVLIEGAGGTPESHRGFGVEALIIPVAWRHMKSRQSRACAGRTIAVRVEASSTNVAPAVAPRELTGPKRNASTLEALIDKVERTAAAAGIGQVPSESEDAKSEDLQVPRAKTHVALAP